MQVNIIHIYVHYKQNYYLLLNYSLELITQNKIKNYTQGLTQFGD